MEAIVDTSQELQLQLGEIALAGNSRALPALQALGLSAQELQAMEPEAAWRAVVEEIQKIPNVANRAIAAEEIFGGTSEKLSGIVNLTNEEFKALEQSVSDTALIYSTEALDGARELDTAMQELKGDVGKLAAEYVVKLVPVLTSAITLFRENEGVQKAVAIAAGLLATALGILAVQWAITTGAIVAAKIALAASTIATGVATAAQWLFNAALAANPIGLVVIAIAALVAGLVLLIANWDTIWPAIKRTWETVSSAILGVWDASWKWLKETFVGVIEWVKDEWDRIWGLIKTAWETITAAIQTVYDNTLGKLFGEEITAAIEFVQTKWDEVWGLVKTGWEIITAEIGTIYDNSLRPAVRRDGL